MTAQAFAVGDRVGVLDGPFAGQEGHAIFTDSGWVEARLASGALVHFKQQDSRVERLPTYAPDTEDTLSLLLAEQRRTNTLLERLLSRPALTLHGMPEQVEESYSARQEHARHRDEATRGMLASQNRAEG